MKIQPELTDRAILAELGRRMSAVRIAAARTQAGLARDAGISKRTLEHLESGDTVQTTSLVRVLRQLELLEVLEVMVPEQGPGPMDLLRLKGKTRRRAYSPRPSAQNTKGSSVAREPDADWSWGDER
jgi:DNA-binding XRE family transcriptional regulator